MTRICDEALDQTDLTNEQLTLNEVKAAFDNLATVLSFSFEHRAPSIATRERLQELATEVASITPDWRGWQEEIGIAAHTPPERG